MSILEVHIVKKIISKYQFCDYIASFVIEHFESCQTWRHMLSMNMLKCFRWYCNLVHEEIIHQYTLNNVKEDHFQLPISRLHCSICDLALWIMTNPEIHIVDEHIEMLKRCCNLHYKEIIHQYTLNNVKKIIFKYQFCDYIASFVI